MQWAMARDAAPVVCVCCGSRRRPRRVKWIAKLMNKLEETGASGAAVNESISEQAVRKKMMTAVGCGVKGMGLVFLK